MSDQLSIVSSPSLFSAPQVIGGSLVTVETGQYAGVNSVPAERDRDPNTLVGSAFLSWDSLARALIGAPLPFKSHTPGGRAE